VWRGFIDELPDFRILAMHTRGLGWSSPAPDGDYRKARIADDAIALLDDLGLERAGLLGHDWGGWAGFIALAAAPERWTGYVATGTPHPWQPPGARLRTAPRTLYQPPIAAPFLGPRLIGRLVPTFLRAGWGERSTYDESAEEIYAATYREPGRAEAASRYYRDFLTREALRTSTARTTVPTKLLYGMREPLGRAGAEGFDDLELLDGCGHFVPEERPEAVAAAVRSMHDQRDRGREFEVVQTVDPH
jgi:pimeloyl-ACP methyl ester carboxylesterase